MPSVGRVEGLAGDRGDVADDGRGPRWHLRRFGSHRGPGGEDARKEGREADAEDREPSRGAGVPRRAGACPTVKTLLFKNIRIVYLTVTGNPLGVKVPYQVCWKQPTGKKKTLKKKCVNATLNGYSWSADASDLRRISTKRMIRRTKFTWYTRGGTPKVLLSKTITVY